MAFTNGQVVKPVTYSNDQYPAFALSATEKAAYVNRRCIFLYESLVDNIPSAIIHLEGNPLLLTQWPLAKVVAV